MGQLAENAMHRIEGIGVEGGGQSQMNDARPHDEGRRLQDRPRPAPPLLVGEDRGCDGERQPGLEHDRESTLRDVTPGIADVGQRDLERAESELAFEMPDQPPAPVGQRQPDQH